MFISCPDFVLRLITEDVLQLSYCVKICRYALRKNLTSQSEPNTFHKFTVFKHGINFDILLCRTGQSV